MKTYNKRYKFSTSRPIGGLLILGGSLLVSCSKSDDINPEDNAPKIVLTKAADAANDWRLAIAAAEADRADVWIDLNNNGKKDEGEAVTKFDDLDDSQTYPLGTSKTVTIYGKVTGLSCYNNELTALDVSKNTALTELYCDDNELSALDLSKHTALTRLYCGDNELTVLDLSKNTALTLLYCDGNDLTTLDLSKNTALTELRCSYNELTTLDISKSIALTELYCHSNQLTSLEVSKNIALTLLSCDDNQLTTLDMSKNTALKALYCSKNQLTALILSPNLTELADVHVYRNKLKINAMSTLVNNLPIRTGKDRGQIWVRFGANDENEVTGNHVTLANNKNWRLVAN